MCVRHLSVEAFVGALDGRLVDELADSCDDAEDKSAAGGSRGSCNGPKPISRRPTLLRSPASRLIATDGGDRATIG